jgi:predicted GIY-YIG superfamily endonuclease
MLKSKSNLEVHYPCGLTLNLEQRYKMSEHLDECGAKIYNIYDSNDMEIIESFDDKNEAQEALKFWNT